MVRLILAASLFLACGMPLASESRLLAETAGKSTSAPIKPPGDGVATAQVDIVVYGGTAGGVIAAVQGARMGKTVLLIEPGKHLGGLTSGGLGATDIGNKAAIGGLSRDFYRRVARYYANDKVWRQETKDAYANRDQRRKGTTEKEMWTFEPHVAEKILREMLAEQKGITFWFGERLDLKSEVVKRQGRIVEIRMESGKSARGKMFIDASYEGDLMAKAGVPYHVGREANKTYGETLNGVQTRNAIYHQFTKKVDPYVVPGDPKSGLLPGVHADGPGEEGAGDHRVQAYCFRLCTTDAPANRRPWPKPAGYDEKRYELLLRNCEAGDLRIPWNPVFMPNRKTDTNNNFAISTDHIGANYAYPNGDYKTRDAIYRDHVAYQQGLLWTLANHPRVPEQVRADFQRLGLAKDEFTDNNNWPHQLYIREARRMISRYVMTQHDCQGRRVANDPVGLAAYTMDSHHVQRYVKNGAAINEGDVQVGGFAPYPISYRSVVPSKKHCENLLVPICLSASHIAYGSIRMEPVFMVLGQTTATAAAMAIDAKSAVQDIDYPALQKRLLADEQVLVWTGPKPKQPVDPKSLPGVVIDDIDAEVSAGTVVSRSIGGFIGASYRYDGEAKKGAWSATFRATLPKDGRYEVRYAYTPSSNRASNVPITIETADGKKKATLNQRKPPKHGAFESLGTFRFERSKPATVTVTNKDTNGFVIIDAVQFLPVK